MCKEQLTRKVLECENKATVFSGLNFGGQNGQSKLASELKYDYENIDSVFCHNLKLSAELRCEENNISGTIGRMSHLAATIVTFSKIMARHFSEMDFCKLIGGKMAGTKMENEEIDIFTKNGDTVQILTSKAENPESRTSKIDNPAKVDYYVVIHYKNDGMARIGVQKVPNTQKKVPQNKRAHLTAKK